MVKTRINLQKKEKIIKTEVKEIRVDSGVIVHCPFFKLTMIINYNHHHHHHNSNNNNNNRGLSRHLANWEDYK